MSLLTVLLSLFFFSGFATAGIYAPDCSLSTWQWTFNSLGQNACTVAAYMLSTCSGGSFTVNALPGPNYAYSGPNVHVMHARDRSGFRMIPIAVLPPNPRAYVSDLSWADYKYNCTNVLLPQLFPNPVPAGTSVPLWALIDVTVEGTWDPTLAAQITPKEVPARSYNSSLIDYHPPDLPTV
ncbi:hypothetical protein BJV77DRAFT_1069924 [Russula vinacea]|nr:hypothetical protein BJV77DRAFT_1069924 [Russula vinacea]